MRTAFHEDLDTLRADLVHMIDLAADAIQQATRALLSADLLLAERVIGHDAEIDALRLQCEERAYALLALQAPVASDLRTIVTYIHTAEKVERMGDLARHVAEQARRHHPRIAAPADTTEKFTEMGRCAVEAAREVQRMISEPTRPRFADLSEADNQLDELEQCLLASVSDQSWPHGVRAGIDVALLARFYERYGDQAVSIARRLDYALTGDMPSSAVTPEVTGR